MKRIFQKKVASVLLLALAMQCVDAKKSQNKIKHVSDGDKFDYIICGFGTAGSLLARFLSDPVNGKFCNSVLVLEAGENHSTDPQVIVNPTTHPNAGEQLTFDPQYAFTQTVWDTNPTQPTGTNGFLTSIGYSDGRLWFGGTAHNGTVAVRGTKDYWDAVASVTGNPIWSYDNLLPFMKFIETYTPADPVNCPVDTTQRGTSGPLQVSSGALPDCANNFLAKAIDTALFGGTGSSCKCDYNVSPTGDVGQFSTQQFIDPVTGLRSFNIVFLPPSMLSPDGIGLGGRKLRVLSSSTVRKVLFKKGTTDVCGVVYTDSKGYKIRAFAKKKVILCTGAINTPALLQRSGVGPAAVLQNPKVNVPIIIENDLVGANLLTHYGPYAIMTNKNNGSSPAVSAVTVYTDGSAIGGLPPLTVAGQRVIQEAFFAIPPALVPFVFQAPKEILAAIQNCDGTPRNIVCVTPSPAQVDAPIIFIFSNNLRPKSLGNVEIISSCPFNPQIRFNRYSDPTSFDFEVAIHVFKQAKAVAEVLGETMLYPTEADFAADAASGTNCALMIAAQGCLISNVSVAYHYTATCKMGTDMSNGVVDSTLHVFGVGNRKLMIADNSVFPLIETGNTQWSAEMAGIVAAKILGAPGLP